MENEPVADSPRDGGVGSEVQTRNKSKQLNRSGLASTLGLFSWALYDWANSAFPTLIQTFVFAAYFTRQVAENQTVGTAQWGQAISAAGLVVALCGPVFGAIADQTGRRKPWIAVFTGLCIVATALLWFVEPVRDRTFFALLLVALGTIGAESAFIFYNAMLPSIASSNRLGRWSGWGWGLGYAGGLACLIVALVGFIGENAWFQLERGSAQHIRATFVLVAIWFSIFSLPLFFFTPDLPKKEKPLRKAAQDGLRQLRHSLHEARRYSHVLRFLIAHLIFIDGLATIFAFGGVFAAGVFDMSEQQVLMFGIALNISAGIGAATFAFLDDWLGGKRTILLSLIGLIVSAGAMLSVRDPALFWFCGIVLGIFVGPVQAASRSYLGRIVPESLRNEMFGLFAFSGKATAFLGPLLVGWITYMTGSQRLGMGIILVFFISGFVLMLGTRTDKDENP